ncbi:hypothetical protein ACLKA7_001657 [Drosophila subpalustris]
MSDVTNSVNSVVSSNGHGTQQNGNSSTSTTSNNTTSTTRAIASTDDELPAIVGQLKTIEQINEQRRIFLKSTIKEIQEEDKDKDDAEPETEPQLRRQQLPPNSLALNVKYATLPSPSVAQSSILRSPLSPPPKPPMLSRTRSTGSGDGIRTSLTNGERHSVAETVVEAEVTTETTGTTATPGAITASTITPTPIKTSSDELQQSPPATVSAKHYESLIEELRCPGCAGPMKAPVLLCKSGHSVCEQCTRILLMCPLCKEGFTSSRSLTIEALCAKAHFGCSHFAGGCTVRMPVALLPWHEQQCIYKPMKCFMGRVWGDCRWHGREVQWKQHLEDEHTDKLFQAPSADLVWNMGIRRKPLTGYYVFQAHDEMFNFYEIYDKQRILFTMTCTSNRRESKYNYAYEVTLLQPDNEAVSLTQKFPVHSEYDRDILMEGTCVSIGLNELARFVDDDKLLHYRVSVMAVKSPRHVKPVRQSLPLNMDYQMRSNGVNGNGKSVPANMIITRTYKEALGEPSTPDAEEENAAGLDLERKWGTPQLHFNRKYLKNTLNAEGIAVDPKEDELSPLQETRSMAAANEDKLSLCSNSTSYTKKVSDSLRRSFRSLKSDLIELRPFTKKKTPVCTTATDATVATATTTKQ